MKLFCITGFALLMVTNIALAEGACPPGQYQTTPPGVTGPVGCAPIPERKESEQKWADQWGAIATDGQKTWGISESMPSKNIAISEAMDDCLTRGGKNCKLKLAYFNQCAAIVGTEENSVVARSPNENKAIDFATEGCRKKSKDKCRVYYSGCSLPVRAQ